MIHLRALGVVELKDGTGEPLSAVLRQPKRLTLLVYLTLRRPAPVASRDALLALFWPDRDLVHARNALNKTLHFLRRALGDGVIESRGRSVVGLAEDTLTSDAVAFQDAVRSGDVARALSQYQGTFLPGLAVAGAPGVEEWIEAERAWYRDTALAVGLDRLEQDLDRGRTRSALELSDALDRIAPREESVVRAAVRSLVYAGDRERAIRRLERYEQWLRDVGGTGVPADLVKLLGTAPSSAGPTGSERAAREPWPGILGELRAYLKVETAEDYAALLDHVPDVVHYCDVRGSLPFVNAAGVALTGYSREEWQTKSYLEIVRPDFRDRVVEFYIRQLDDRVPVTYLEFPIVTRDEREVWVGQQVRLVEKDGEPIGSAGVVRDITSRVRREEAVRRLALEDRETRVLNGMAMHMALNQRIRFNRRSGASFFTLHLSLLTSAGELPHMEKHDADRAALRVTGALRPVIRASDLLGRLGPVEFVILTADGSTAAADIMLTRLRSRLDALQKAWEVDGLALSSRATVHDPQGLESADVVLGPAWPALGHDGAPAVHGEGAPPLGGRS